MGRGDYNGGSAIWTANTEWRSRTDEVSDVNSHFERRLKERLAENQHFIDLEQRKKAEREAEIALALLAHEEKERFLDGERQKFREKRERLAKTAPLPTRDFIMKQDERMKNVEVVVRKNKRLKRPS